MASKQTGTVHPHPSTPHSTQPPLQPVFGQVNSAEGQLVLDGDPVTPGCWPIAELAEHLGQLEVGDRLAGTLINGSHLIITSRLVPMNTDTPPLIEELEDGRLRLNASQGLILQAGDSRIELQANGTLRINGENIYTLANRHYHLQSAKVAFN